MLSLTEWVLTIMPGTMRLQKFALLRLFARCQEKKIRPLTSPEAYGEVPM